MSIALEGYICRVRFECETEIILQKALDKLSDLGMHTRLHLQAISFGIPQVLWEGGNPPSPPYGNCFNDVARFSDLLHQSNFDPMQVSLQAQANYNGVFPLRGPENVFKIFWI